MNCKSYPLISLTGGDFCFYSSSTTWQSFTQPLLALSCSSSLHREALHDNPNNSQEGDDLLGGYTNNIFFSSISQAKFAELKSHLSLGSLDQIIPQNQSIAVPQPNASIINLIRVVGAWKEAIPTKERTRQNAKP